MAKKFYAVKNGKNGDGIYDSWEACKAQVHGVKSVVFKGFPTRAEAEDFLQRAGASTTEGEAPENPQREGIAVAYVDGSFSKDTGEFACGAVLFWKGERVLFSKKYNDPALAEMHNVAGEILGAVAVIRYCLDKGIPALEIHHDYEGVGKWATGLWKANKPGTQAYAALCKQAMERLQLSFVKVKGHSGNQWNDLADQLARRALGRAGSSACRYETTMESRISELTDGLLAACDKLEADLAEAPVPVEARLTYFHAVIFEDMTAARKLADQLETLVERKAWPFPTYSDMLFYML